MTTVKGKSMSGACESEHWSAYPGFPIITLLAGNIFTPLLDRMLLLCTVKLSRYVTVDGGGNSVTFHKLNVQVQIKKIITPHNDSLSDRFVQICLLLVPPSF